MEICEDAEGKIRMTGGELLLRIPRVNCIYFRVLSKKLAICQKASLAGKLCDSWPSSIIKPCGSP